MIDEFQINFDPFALGRQWVIWLKKQNAPVWFYVYVSENYQMVIMDTVLILSFSGNAGIAFSHGSSFESYHSPAVPFWSWYFSVPHRLSPAFRRIVAFQEALPINEFTHFN